MQVFELTGADVTAPDVAGAQSALALAPARMSI
jgi:hypothetical protein